MARRRVCTNAVARTLPVQGRQGFVWQLRYGDTHPRSLDVCGLPRTAAALGQVETTQADQQGSLPEVREARCSGRSKVLLDLPAVFRRRQ